MVRDDLGVQEESVVELWDQEPASLLLGYGPGEQGLAADPQAALSDRDHRGHVGSPGHSGAPKEVGALAPSGFVLGVLDTGKRVLLELSTPGGEVPQCSQPVGLGALGLPGQGALHVALGAAKGLVAHDPLLHGAARHPVQILSCAGLDLGDGRLHLRLGLLQGRRARQQRQPREHLFLPDQPTAAPQTPMPPILHAPRSQAPSNAREAPRPGHGLTMRRLLSARERGAHRTPAAQSEGL